MIADFNYPMSGWKGDGEVEGGEKEGNKEDGKEGKEIRTKKIGRKGRK